MYALMENGEIVERIYDTYFNWVVSDMAKLDLELLDELYVARSFFQLKRERPAFRSDRKAYFIDPFLFRVFYKRYSGTHEVPYERIAQRSYYQKQILK